MKCSVRAVGSVRVGRGSSAAVAILALAFLGLAVSGCSQAPRSLVGAWEIVTPGSGSREPDSAGADAANPFVSVKVLSDSHFAFGHQAPSGEVFAGGGLYAYDGRGHYTEFVTYHSMPHLVGQRIDFTCRLEGDLWYHDAFYRVDGQVAEIHEVWRRLREASPFIREGLPAPGRERPDVSNTTRAAGGSPRFLAGN